MRFALSLTSTPLGRQVYGFINGQWRWNAAVTGLVIKPLMGVGYVVSKVLDRGVIETVGPYGLTTLLQSTGRSIAQYDTSVVTGYALYIVIGYLSLVLLLAAPYVLPGVAFVSDGSSLLVFIASLAMLPSISNSVKNLLFNNNSP